MSLPPSRVRELDVPSEPERQQAADLLATAFVDAVSIRDMSDVGHDPSLLKEFFLALFDACLIGGSVTAYVGDKEGEIDGVALWWGPGRVMFGLEEERQIFAAFRVKMSQETQRWWTEEFLPHPGKVDSITGKETQAGWYLAAVAVRPGAQSRGVGTTLVQHGLAQATRDNVPAVVEYTDPKNVGAVLTRVQVLTLQQGAFYKKLGFEVRGTAQKSGPHSTWTTWFCVREVPV